MSKILIIEDDAVVGHIYKSRLAAEGHQVELCTDGQSGFYRVHEFCPDVVLLDLMLPKMNGVDILKKIHAQAQFAHTPVIVLTNAYVPHLIHEAFQAGARHVFNKATLTPRQLLEAVRDALLRPVPEPVAGPSLSPRPLPASEPKGAGLVDPATLGEPPFRDTAPTLAPSPTPAPSAGPAPVACTPAPVRLKAGGDEEFRADLLATFMDRAPETLDGLRRALEDFIGTQDPSARQACLLELYRKVHALTGAAGIAGLHCLSQMAAALEVLLKELHEKPKHINPSTLRTVAQAIDFIGELMTKGLDAEQHQPDHSPVLVVDDEILSRRAVAYALEKADLKCVSVEDPYLALKLAGEQPFSLIFLDVQMPGMDGFELCSKIRTLPLNKQTPIIFVTSLTDFKSRAKSTLSGGNDLIAKPFMFIELSVKALIYVLRGRLPTVRRAAA